MGDELAYLLGSQFAVPTPSDTNPHMNFFEPSFSIGVDKNYGLKTKAAAPVSTGVWRANPVQGGSKDLRLQRVRSGGPRRRHKLYKVGPMYYVNMLSLAFLVELKSCSPYLL